MWNVFATEEYLTWFSFLSEFDKKEVNYLTRPHADTLNGSEIKNMKKLRIKTDEHIVRILYYFNNKRNGILLTAGDKKGKDEKRFYKKLIQEAEKIIKLYQEEI